MKSLLGLTCLLVVFNAYAELGLNAIYKKNDLQFVKKNSSAKIQELSKSVAMIIHKDALLGEKIKTTKLTDPNGLNICPDEKFTKSNSVSACTGFLIAPDLILTAGHCFENMDDCENKLIIFDVLNSVARKNNYKVKSQNVFSCKEVVHLDSVGDIVLIRLNRQANERKHLHLRAGGEVALGKKVMMLGHPLGMPLIQSKTARVRDTSNSLFFRADLDSFVGSSGSPVFNLETYEVEGVLVSGQDDFWADTQNKCNRFKTYDYNSGVLSGEVVSRIYNVLGFFNPDQNTTALNN